MVTFYKFSCIIKYYLLNNGINNFDFIKYFKQPFKHLEHQIIDIQSIFM
jgi:hypothetical protein